MKPITRALSLCFVGSFVVSVSSFVGLIIVGLTAPPHHSLTGIQGLLVFLMLVTGPVWYVSLGMITSRLGRRWLVWVGLSFITSPIGPLVIFPLMLDHIKAARPAAPASPIS